MIIQQLKQKQYEQLQNTLKEKARTEPLDVSYKIDMTINNVTYEIKLQLEKHYKVAVLQAVKLDKKDNTLNYELISRGSTLFAFFTIFVYHELS